MSGDRKLPVITASKSMTAIGKSLGQQPTHSGQWMFILKGNVKLSARGQPKLKI